MEPLAALRFSHLVVGGPDMDRAPELYRGLLGMDVVFDQTMSGVPFDHALGGSGEHRGRVVGGRVGGVRMFFVKDPDGTALEFIEFPGEARTSEELHRGPR